jgi:hypothetical protein
LRVLGSLFNTSMFFLHFGEQNHRTVPSFLTSIVPDPFDTGLSQKLHGLTIRLI